MRAQAGRVQTTSEHGPHMRGDLESSGREGGFARGVEVDRRELGELTARGFEIVRRSPFREQAQETSRAEELERELLFVVGLGFEAQQPARQHTLRKSMRAGAVFGEERTPTVSLELVQL